MSDKIHKDIMENWNSWKYDIADMNKSEWSKSDQSVLDTIGEILSNELSKDIRLVNLESEVKRIKKHREEEIMALYAEVKRLKNLNEDLQKELHDRKTND